MSDEQNVSGETVESPTGQVAVASTSKRGRGRTPDPNSSLSKARVLYASQSWKNAKEFAPRAAAQLGVSEKVATTYFYIAKKDANGASQSATPTA